jgi:hypothetical protein
VYCKKRSPIKNIQKVPFLSQKGEYIYLTCFIFPVMDTLVPKWILFERAQLKKAANE